MSVQSQTNRWRPVSTQLRVKQTCDFVFYIWTLESRRTVEIMGIIPSKWCLRSRTFLNSHSKRNRRWLICVKGCGQSFPIRLRTIWGLVLEAYKRCFYSVSNMLKLVFWRMGCLLQELCRQRMAVKPSNERPEPISSRINSVSSQFSDAGPAVSPSARSSVSSWSEEPAHSNMDISTGHMILVSTTRLGNFSS